MRVGIATDHGGPGLKEELVGKLRATGHEVVDFGAYTLNPGDDYPDFVIPLARAAGKVTAGKESQSSAHGDEAAVLGDVRHIDVYNRSFESGVLASLRGRFPEYDSALWDSAEAKE